MGFYASTMMKRWWDQTSKLPKLKDVAMVLNAIFQPGIFDFSIKHGTCVEENILL